MTRRTVLTALILIGALLPAVHVAAQDQIVSAQIVGYDTGNTVPTYATVRVTANEGQDVELRLRVRNRDTVNTTVRVMVPAGQAYEIPVAITPSSWRFDADRLTVRDIGEQDFRDARAIVTRERMYGTS